MAGTPRQVITETGYRILAFLATTKKDVRIADLDIGDRAYSLANSQCKSLTGKGFLKEHVSGTGGLSYSLTAHGKSTLKLIELKKLRVRPDNKQGGGPRKKPPPPDPDPPSHHDAYTQSYLENLQDPVAFNSQIMECLGSIKKLCNTVLKNAPSGDPQTGLDINNHAKLEPIQKIALVLSSIPHEKENENG